MSKKILFTIIMALVFFAGLFIKDRTSMAIILLIVSIILSVKLKIIVENKL